MPGVKVFDELREPTVMSRTTRSAPVGVTGAGVTGVVGRGVVGVGFVTTGVAGVGEGVFVDGVGVDVATVPPLFEGVEGTV